MPDEVMAKAAAKLDQPLQDKTMAAQIAAFFKAPRSRAPAKA